MLTVIAIIGILAAILIPVVSKVRDSTRTAKCASNLRQIGAAVYSYAMEHEDRLPVLQVGSIGDPDAQRWWTVLPGYIEGRDYAQQHYDRTQGNTIFFCPTAIHGRTPTGGRNFTYGMNPFASGGFDNLGVGPGMRLGHIPDPSLTALFMDGSYHPEAGQGHWANAVMNREPYLPEFIHNDQVNVVFVDGHVELVGRATVEQPYDEPFWGRRNAPWTR